ncbi:hypothetical protein QO002_003309 [Pararhizobium capsulatum DSM 1112]|uniref:Uncharacterized protein n=1 Tax=Pararhizobium capsulatum DSM 1112 TaxID=1121113 RepID=A0ABU0BU35_9HYPH|nr:hypothetical protein [Pararhizobium capsulatum]MDQ0321171.1 hypothetical protein [Pararhizobium capsulatum DSM 1112]
MALTAQSLAESEDFFAAMRASARALTAMFAEFPRLSSIFASQQRWLLAQAGFAIYFGCPALGREAGLYSGRFVATAVEYDIASRNTAAAFLQEMLAYRFVKYIDNPPDNRTRPLEPTETALHPVRQWMHVHLAILDGLDGGRRADMLAKDPAMFPGLEARTAYSILENQRLRQPGEAFNLFTWANAGGGVMDYFIGRIESWDRNDQQVAVGPIVAAELCRTFMISKTHFKRLMKRASEMGSLGFQSTGPSAGLWLSQGFVTEYRNYQAEKFAIIDAAFEAEAGKAPAFRELKAVL